jgi:hypothetical protein
MNQPPVYDRVRKPTLFDVCNWSKTERSADLAELNCGQD